MFGENPIRLPVKGSGDMLEVKNIFPTVQGEGPFAGMPAVFVRLGGCNLACSFCDTEFEQFEPMTVADIVLNVAQRVVANDYPQGRKLVVITGGEPLRQPIAPLCEALLAAGYQVQVETNGTLFRPLPEAVHVICSPKNTDGKGYAPVRSDVLERANALKFIVSSRINGYTHVAEVGQSRFGTPVYIQPMDEYEPQQNAANVQHASQLAAQHGYKLSLQTHKIIGVE